MKDITGSIRLFLKSEEKFPIDINWFVEVGLYAHKAEAKRAVKKSGFSQGVDFSAQVLKTSTGGRPNESITLTCDCAKHLCMLSRSDLGMQIRQAFIDIEKDYKELIHSYNLLSQTTNALQEVTKELKTQRHEREQQKRAHPIGFDLIQDTSSIEMTALEYLQFNKFTSEQIKYCKSTLARRAAAAQRTGTGEQYFEQINSSNKLRYSYLEATAKSMGLI